MNNTPNCLKCGTSINGKKHARYLNTGIRVCLDCAAETRAALTPNPGGTGIVKDVTFMHVLGPAIQATGCIDMDISDVDVLNNTDPEKPAVDLKIRGRAEIHGASVRGFSQPYKISADELNASDIEAVAPTGGGEMNSEKGGSKGVVLEGKKDVNAKRIYADGYEEGVSAKSMEGSVESEDIIALSPKKPTRLWKVFWFTVATGVVAGLLVWLLTSVIETQSNQSSQQTNSQPSQQQSQSTN